jgi:hypothetical protein
VPLPLPLDDEVDFLAAFFGSRLRVGSFGTDPARSTTDEGSS